MKKPRNDWGALALGVLLLGSLVPLCVHAAVGRTPGAFSVSSSGSATYTIPIWVPPGPHGMQPKLSFVYNSRMGPGPMGRGWSLAGLSQISRCGKTYAQDTTPAAVTLTYSDAFCLDGKRLRLTSSEDLSTYGQDGTTYQTEIADFSNVTAHGQAGNGPSYFTVQGKDGLTYEYGNGGNSQVLATNTSTASVWLLDKVTDRSNNSMVISYTAPSSTLTGITVPDTVSWTPSAAGSSSYNYSLKFNYTNSNLPQSSIFKYVAGTSVVNQDLLLSAVIRNSAGSTVKQYVLGYDTSPTTGGYRLTQVKECADAAASNCLLPTVISYQSGSPGVSDSPITVATNNNNQVLGVLDFDGDGRDDVLYADPNSNLYISFGSATGLTAPVSTGIYIGLPPIHPTGAPYPLVVTGDVRGTGKASILLVQSGYWWEYFWNSSSHSFSSANTNIQQDPNTETFAALADVDGDGLLDLLTGSVNQSTLTIYYRNNINRSAGTASFSSTRTVAYSAAGCGTEYNLCEGRLWTSQSNRTARKVDFNGDGMADLVLQTTYMNCGGLLCTRPPFGGGEQVLMSTGSGFIVAPVTVTSASGNYFTAITDINNDGCSDIVVDTVVYISGCNGSSPQQVTFGTNVLGSMDWDGDGRPDVLVQNGDYVGVYLATGNGLSSLVTTSIPLSLADPVYVGSTTGDGLDTLIGTNTSTITAWNHNGAGQPPDLLSSVSDGFGNSSAPTYVSITQSNYTTASIVSYPEQEYPAPLYVVSQVAQSDGVGGTYHQTYTYGGVRYNLQGFGFEGFIERIASDDRPGSLVEHRLYQTLFPFTGIEYWNEFDLSDNTSSGFASYSYQKTDLDTTTNNQRMLVYEQRSYVQRREIGGALNNQIISTTETTYTVDNSGNVTNSTETITDEDPNSPYVGQQWVTSVNTTFHPDLSGNWCLNLPTAISVTKSATTAAAITRTMTFPDAKNDYAKCRSLQRIIAPGDPKYQVTMDIGYDAFGNVSSTTITGIRMPSRSTNTSWGTTGQFPVSITNALSQSSSFGYDFDHGTPVTFTDPNGITTSWHYDAFGRKDTETRPDGTYTTWAFNDCAASGGCLVGSHAVVRSQMSYNQGGTVQSDSTTYFDPVDRELVVSKRMLASGAYDRNELHYDRFGRIASQSMPCTWISVSTPCPYATTTQYDALGRPVQIQRPINAGNTSLQTTQIQYAGRTTTTTDPQNNQSIRVMTVAGTLGRSQDEAGYYLNFNYDAFGSLLSVTDMLSNTLFTATYDYGLEAFQTQFVDMDLGTRNYTYDALGEITSSSDLNGNSVSYTYDVLFRPLTRAEPDLTTTWQWGNSAIAYNIGRLQSVSANNYSESYTYDSKGRLSTRAITIPSYGTYQYDYAYNSSSGLLDTLTYPTSTSSYRLKLQYVYQNGILQQISDANAPSTVFWAANEENVRRQVTQETLGNGVVTSRQFDPVTGWLNSTQSGPNGASNLQNESYLFDLAGNLIQRQNNNTALTENFYYDALYRLDHSTLTNGTTSTNLALTYDLMGNITSRSDVAAGATWTYDAQRKHAVRQAGSSSFTFAYDANGNAVSRNGYVITWASYNQPLSISAAGESVQFTYNHNHERWSAVYSGPGGIETTYFVGKLLEIIPGSDPEFRHYIYAGSTKVGVYSRRQSGVTMRYLREDHLGSVSGIISSDGTSFVKESFTAFGSRRSACTWSGAPTSGDLAKINAVTRRGYTWQFALGEMGLNDMHGRVEDAVVGRFLSADPFVQDPSSTQSFNRYSYVENNPLTYRDPSGFHWACWNQPITSSSDYGFDLPPTGDDNSPTYLLGTSYSTYYENQCADIGGDGTPPSDGPGGNSGSGSPPPRAPDVPPPLAPVNPPQVTSPVMNWPYVDALDQCLHDALDNDDHAGESSLAQGLSNLTQTQSALESTTERLAAATALNLGRAFGPTPGITIPTNAGYAQFGEQVQSSLETAAPYIKGAGYVLGGLSVATSTYQGYQQNGTAGAISGFAFGTIDFGLEAFFTGLGPLGAGAAIAYDRAGGSRAYGAMVQATGRLQACQAAAGNMIIDTTP